MKVKCINTDCLPCNENLTVGKIYEAKEALYTSNHYLVINDDGYELGYWKYRFEKVKDLDAELKEAKQKVKDLENQIEEINRPKVGQRYKNKLGSCYVVSKVNNRFALVCYEGSNIGGIYGHVCHLYIDDIFNGCRSYFTLLK
jgi:hypothetical protein